MANLPVREMVLYKHGVGFFVRQGEISGERVSLIFKQDEINDILKSLAVFDRAGGQVLGIHYQTPKNMVEWFKDTSINLSHEGSLNDLIRDLRGRRVTATLETAPGEQQIISGRVVGLDVVGNKQREQQRFTVLDDAGQVHVLRGEHIVKLTIEDQQASQDLSYFLDTSMTDDVRRTIHLRLSEGEHDLAVYYVAPSPVWRVSYRLVAESDESSATGKALLQGWGLFDNRLDEDLNDVKVTLVAGQPISFIYDLYSSRIPQRKLVQDAERIAPGPVEFAGMDFMESGENPDWLNERAEKSVVDRELFERRAPSASFHRAAAPKSMQSIAQTSDLGETFQYEVTTPVTVKRGESALVPIISEEVGYERELLYNRKKLADHPVAAMRFENTTGLTLERGPVTVVEDGVYKGEAIIDFTKPDNAVYLPFAVELGVKVIENTKRTTEIAGISLKGAFAVFDEYQIETTITTFENTTSKPVTVTLEASINAFFTLFDTPDPSAQTATERRWKVDVAEKSRVAFTRKERILNQRQTKITELRYQQIDQFMENRWLEKSTLESLREIIDNHQLIARARKRLDELKNDEERIQQRQQHTHEGMAKVGTEGEEGLFRGRLLKKLQDAEDQLDAIEAERSQLREQIDTAEATINALLAALNTDGN